ncbi:hypothetical protein L861_02220 [Litchfieldella anticariensis FP35 = DSM 16096]|uniref:Sulfotransferase domain-containing protein n=1 Tax=Litchfieldella anticariensis (strain DSM 16096 / CECT 5854 / CIP 108499 / LMG 22089 / FP35) TaxID=1121939 RepID=S2L8H7_LITA3|nr:sulfotransferase domain-containing protein [Halomonas anticariensis]EPC04149.1 hypothetical protein L861_02220 [Halomonas anticariensis FP35 = DSM 16096]
MLLKDLNLFIVGAPKSGTTALYEYLKESPDVFFPDFKEPNYFSNNPEGIKDEEEYLKIFDGHAGEAIVGECSTSYLYDGDAPKRIKNSCAENTKIIISLRNPVNMSFSLWQHNVRNGREKLSYQDAVKSIKERRHDSKYIKQGIHRFEYIERARYASQVEQYINEFGESNVKIFIYEELFDNIDSGYVDICNWLGVTAANVEFSKHNEARVVKNQAIQSLVRPSGFLSSVSKKILTRNMRKKVREKISSLNSKPGKYEVPDKFKNELVTYFENDVDSLINLAGVDVKKYWKHFN